MANINVSENDFFLAAGAANRAKDAGDRESAQGLDKLARKINASLSAQSGLRATRGLGRLFKTKPFTWRDVPTTLKP